MLATWRLSFMCVSVSTGDPVSQHSQSLCSLARSPVRSQPGLVRSLAHSSFQFASESKGLIKSPQTGFSGISRVNAKESQADQQRRTVPGARLQPPVSSVSIATICSQPPIDDPYPSISFVMANFLSLIDDPRLSVSFAITSFRSSIDVTLLLLIIISLLFLLLSSSL